jgi:dolichol-phosphate mannosyltransferase
LFNGFLRRIKVLYFIRDFGLMTIFLIAGLLLFGFGCIFGGYHWIISVRAQVAATTGTVMLSALPTILGFQLLLQALLLDIQNEPVTPISRELNQLELFEQFADPKNVNPHESPNL